MAYFTTYTEASGGITLNMGFSETIPKEDFSNWTRHLGNADTHWLAMKGVHPDDELQALPTDFRLSATHVLRVPGCQGQRHLLILRRSV